MSHLEAPDHEKILLQDHFVSRFGIKDLHTRIMFNENWTNRTKITL
jgi:hypothetical protein